MALTVCFPPVSMTTLCVGWLWPWISWFCRELLFERFDSTRILLSRHGWSWRMYWYCCQDSWGKEKEESTRCSRMTLLLRLLPWNAYTRLFLRYISSYIGGVHSTSFGQVYGVSPSSIWSKCSYRSRLCHSILIRRRWHGCCLDWETGR